MSFTRGENKSILMRLRNGCFAQHLLPFGHATHQKKLRNTKAFSPVEGDILVSIKLLLSLFLW
jgi:hypothetical protein